MGWYGGLKEVHSGQEKQQKKCTTQALGTLAGLAEPGLHLLGEKNDQSFFSHVTDVITKASEMESRKT